MVICYYNLQVTITLFLAKLCEINNNKYKLGTEEHNIPNAYGILNLNT